MGAMCRLVFLHHSLVISMNHKKAYWPERLEEHKKQKSEHIMSPTFFFLVNGA